MKVTTNQDTEIVFTDKDGHRIYGGIPFSVTSYGSTKIIVRFDKQKEDIIKQIK